MCSRCIAKGTLCDSMKGFSLYLSLYFLSPSLLQCYVRTQAGCSERPLRGREEHSYEDVTEGLCWSLRLQRVTYVCVSGSYPNILSGRKWDSIKPYLSVSIKFVKGFWCGIALYPIHIQAQLWWWCWWWMLMIDVDDGAWWMVLMMDVDDGCWCWRLMNGVDDGCWCSLNVSLQIQHGAHVQER